MGKVIEFGRRDKTKLPKGFWQQEYLLFPGFCNIAAGELPSKNELPSGTEITLHPGNAARLLVNNQMLRLLALSPRELREAVFVTPQKILKFRYAYDRRNNALSFTGFLKNVSLYVNKLGAVVVDNLGMRCWFPEQWLEMMGSGQFDLKNHLTIHTVPEKESALYWMHTHGMVQFGCPDMEVRMVSREGLFFALRILCRFIHYLVKNGPVLKEGCRVAISRGLCWATFNYGLDLPNENHYQNNYFKVMITMKQ